MEQPEDEDGALRSVALQNAQAVLIARQRAEEELLRAKAALERKNAELANSLAMVRATLESTTDGILVTDGERLIIGFNAKFAEMWSLPRELLDAGEHRQLVQAVSRHFGDPQRFVARIEEIYATSPPETYDVLEPADGRAIERFSRVQLVEGQNVGRVWSFRDITERRRDESKLRHSEQALRKSEAQLRMVTDHAPVLIARCDKEGRFRFVNRRYAERFDLLPQDLVGKTIAEVLGPAAHEAMRPFVDAVLSGKPVEYEAEIEYERLGRRYMRCAYEPERDEAGQVQGWIAVVTDITEQQRAEEARVVLGAIVESSQDAIVSKTLEGRILSWNGAAQQLFGYSAAEAIGLPITTIIPSDRLGEEQLIIERLRRGERIDHYETVRVAKDGRRIDVSLSISPLRNAAGRVVGASKIARDISARLRTEQSTRFLADASAALAELTDYESTLRRIAGLAVPAFADWCAVDVQAEDGSIRRLVVNHLDPARVESLHDLDRKYPARPTGRGSVRRVLRTGEPEWETAIPDDSLAAWAEDEEHLRLIRGMGLRSYICVPLKSRSAPLGTLTFATSESGRAYDVQDLRMAEDLAHRAAVAVENARLLEALRETDRRKDEFLATLAHELRNPLAPVSNALQVMRMSEGMSAAAGELRDVMERQVSHLIRLVDDLMEISRISRGKIELRKAPVALSTIVGTALEISRPSIDEAGHKLSVSLPGEEIVLHADQVRLSQVLTNLLANAAKYTEAGGSIELAAWREGGEAVLSVKDSGLGIPPHLLPRVFEMFAQMEHTRGRAHGGLGIGLALAKSLVEMHGGRIEARSEGLGKGSQFVVRLPVAKDGSDRPVANAPAAAAAPLERRKILVVDDTRAALFVLDKLLTAMGQQVRTVQDPAAALQAARDDPPDVIISDIGMPNIDGYELARHVRQAPGLKDVMLVALTGYGQISDRQRAKDAGFDHHLVKPVSVDDLHALLSTLSGRSGR